MTGGGDSVRGCQAVAEVANLQACSVLDADAASGAVRDDSSLVSWLARFPLQIRLSAINVPTTEAAPQHRKKVNILLLLIRHVFVRTNADLSFFC